MTETILSRNAIDVTELSHCAQAVRKDDRDRFLCSLFAPPDRRESLWALYAFNLELARIREVVREPLLGAMRLQWWREALQAALDGERTSHPVAVALADAMKRFPLDRHGLAELIDGRNGDWDDRLPADMDQLVAYAEATSGMVACLSLDVLDVDDEAAYAAARHVGIAYALAGLMRAVPFHARHGRLMLPADVTQANGLRPEGLSGPCTPAGLTAVVATVAARANDHLAEARALRTRVPKRAIPPMLLATLTDGYLVRLRQAKYDPNDPRIAAPFPAAPIRLAAQAWRRRY